MQGSDESTPAAYACRPAGAAGSVRALRARSEPPGRATGQKKGAPVRDFAEFPVLAPACEEMAVRHSLRDRRRGGGLDERDGMGRDSLAAPGEAQPLAAL